MFGLAGMMFIMALCGFANFVSIGNNYAITRLFDPNTDCIIGGVFFTIGLLWPKRFIKK